MNKSVSTSNYWLILKLCIGFDNQVPVEKKCRKYWYRI